MGQTKKTLIETEDNLRMDAWSDLPLTYQVDIEADLDRNHARSWITTKIAEDEQDIERKLIGRSTGDMVYYRGRFSSLESAEEAVFAFVSSARASHETMEGSYD